MSEIKVLLAISAIFCTIATLVLIWTEDNFVFGTLGSKIYASLFSLLAVVLTREYYSVFTEQEETE